jgi:hypothetical protein
MSKVRIGDLDLEASEAWVFRQTGPMVLARRDAGCGSLQISTAFRYDLQGAQTPEACLAIARKFVSRAAISEPFDTTQVVDGGLLFGGFSYSAGEQFGRVWYFCVMWAACVGCIRLLA